ncbi:hypothetical protein HPB52_002126 [Rhipicephalus sanguineus]|uniref:Uncharacterized protein n=1 Tax=Rhipicephalus sanguineus TaxID=34632 RepID=A0A9D4QCV1_RHISA|nr:hypothetical protein HPB52_002126 [Rhipicephalus sanguineus]
MPAVRRRWLPICLVFLSATVLGEIEAGGAEGTCEPNETSEDIGDRSTCTFTTTFDRDATRVPPELPVVRCRCPDGRCGGDGDFRCHEVTHNVTVAYRVPGSSTLRNKVIRLTTACVCAIGKSQEASDGLVRPANLPRKELPM